jgi:hypothetical protein
MPRRDTLTNEIGGAFTERSSSVHGAFIERSPGVSDVFPPRRSNAQTGRTRRAERTQLPFWQGDQNGVNVSILVRKINRSF